GSDRGPARSVLYVIKVERIEREAHNGLDRDIRESQPSVLKGRSQFGFRAANIFSNRDYIEAGAWGSFVRGRLRSTDKGERRYCQNERRCREACKGQRDSPCPAAALLVREDCANASCQIGTVRHRQERRSLRRRHGRGIDDFLEFSTVTHLVVRIHAGSFKVTGDNRWAERGHRPRHASTTVVSGSPTRQRPSASSDPPLAGAAPRPAGGRGLPSVL